MVWVTNSGSDSEFPIEEMGIFGIHHVQRTNIGVVDTPAPDRRDWPSIEDFQAPETTLKWRDVQPGMYKILEIFKHSQNKYGPRVVLNLKVRMVQPFYRRQRIRYFMQQKIENLLTSSLILEKD